MAAESAGGSDEDLLAALHAAPTHGFNARELLLSVARDPSLSGPQDAAGEQRQSADRAQIDKPSSEALWSALPPSERPMVAFIARNPKVARAARQKVLNRQVAEELAKAAAQTGLPGADAVAKLAASPELRTACIVAARAAELDLYNRCKSTAVYLNLAARRSATESEDAAKSDAGDVRVAQEPARPQQAAQSTAKRKRAQESAALLDAGTDASVAAATANPASPEQTGAEAAQRTEGIDNAAAAHPDPDIAVRKAKLNLVDDDVDWNVEAATD